MFAAIAPMQQPSNGFQPPWTPARPSPLSPRRASSTNFATPQPQFQSPTSLFAFTPSHSPSQAKSKAATEPINKTTLFSSPSQSENTNIFNAATSPTPNPSSNSTYATRYTNQISNPLSRKAFTSSASPPARSVRRNAFLNRVKHDRDSGRLEARAERLAYMEDIAEQKEWDDKMRRRAEEIQRQIQAGGDFEGEDFAGADDAEIQALDEYIEQERAMEMELLQQMEGDQPGNLSFPNGNLNPNHASSFSDDEYDDIFMDLADHVPAEDMDMSG
ncbi:hypothetical protein BDV18DRAFT_131202 [Aspergillus unguis]